MSLPKIGRDLFGRDMGHAVECICDDCRNADRLRSNIAAMNRQTKEIERLTRELSEAKDDAVKAWTEVHRLRAAVAGPEGFATWQEAAVAERIKLSEARAEVERQRFALRQIEKCVTLNMAGKIANAALAHPKAKPDGAQT